MIIDSALSVAKAIGPPGSVRFGLLVLAAALLLFRIGRRFRRLGWALLIGVSAFYLVLSLPVVARALVGGLPAVETASPAAPGRIDVLVVLDGDNREGRVVETMRVFGTSAPRQVWALGGDELRDDLNEAGLPRDRLSSDPAPATTRAQMARVRTIVASHPGASVGVVASRIQMPRVAALAAASHLHVVLLASPVDRTPPVRGWLPAVSALYVSRDALYEHAALAYYAWRGWIGSGRS